MKKKTCKKWNGLLPIFILCYVTIQKSYRDTVGLGVQQEGHDTANSLATRATTRPRGLVTWPACGRGKQQRARTWPGRWGVSRYKWLYHDRRGRPGVVVECSRGCDTAQQRPVTRHKNAVTRVATSVVRIESRYNFLYRDRGATAAVLRYGSMRT